MLATTVLDVPAINIEFCAEQIPVPEPASPFTGVSFVVQSLDAEKKYAHRSQHLLPPPTLSPKDRVMHQKPRSGLGLDPARFEALRQAARSSPPTPKLDLRKEVAVRVHKSKQLERRSLFLSKIEALPSPTAASLPVTPPESPAVFHFTLPSPGLVSPLALFESLDSVVDSRPVRVEQVDFRAKARREAEALAAVTGNMKQSLQFHGLSAIAPHHQVPREETKSSSGATATALPSLDQISKRLGGNITVSRTGPATSSNRLPAFLKRSNSSVQNNDGQSPVTSVSSQSIPLVSPIPKSTGLPFVPTSTHGPIARPLSSTGNKASRPPLRPASVTLPGPRIASTKAPTPLTAAALSALADRAERGSVMMERLKRRFSAPAELGKSQQRTPGTRKIPGYF